jgi:hypothetical protein
MPEKGEALIQGSLRLVDADDALLGGPAAAHRVDRSPCRRDRVAVLSLVDLLDGLAQERPDPFVASPPTGGTGTTTARDVPASW